VTIAMGEPADYVKVVNGDMSGTRAFTSGKGKVRGPVRVAMKMRNIFPQA
jgi:putative sterol carrier protein